MDDDVRTTHTAEDHAATVEEARERLAEARSRATAPRATLPSVFVTYAILCVAGSTTTIGLHLAALAPATPGFAPKTAVLVMAFAWIAVGLVPALVVRDAWRRGFARRWILMAALWGVLWIVAMLVAESRAALIVAPFFLVLFVMALTTEMAARQQELRAGARR